MALPKGLVRVLATVLFIFLSHSIASVVGIYFGLGPNVFLIIFLPLLAFFSLFTLCLFILYRFSAHASRAMIIAYTLIFFLCSIFLTLFISSLISLTSSSSSSLSSKQQILDALSRVFTEPSSAIPCTVVLSLLLCLQIQVCALSRPRLRTPLYCWVVSYPASVFVSSVVYGLPLYPWVASISLPPYVSLPLLSLPWLASCFGE